MTETLTRDDIAAHIAELRAKQQRLPKAYVEEREEYAQMLEVLVLDWLHAEP